MKLSCYISGEEEGCPVLVVEGEFGVAGYYIGKSTGSLSRVCICNAHSSNECCCGAWDED